MDTQPQVHLSPLPAPGRAETPTRSELQDIRGTLLDWVLKTTSILAAIVLLVTLLSESKFGQWGNFLVMSGLYVCLVVITLMKRLSYRTRVAGLLAVLYFMGAANLLENGSPGSGCIVLFALPVVATLLAGRRSAMLVLAISAATLLLTGMIAVGRNSNMPVGTGPVSAAQPGFWIILVITFVILGWIVIQSQTRLLSSLESSILGFQQQTAMLESRQEELERQVRSHSTDLERRLVQIQTAAEISRSFSALAEPDELLHKVVDLVKERFDLYYIGIFLVDDYGEYALLKAGSGEAGRQMVARGHRLAVGGDSMIGWSIANRKARIALDVGKEAVRFENPFLPQTHSELALPIQAGDHVLGAITVQSEQQEAFDEADITVLQGIADSLAIALENARLFAETQRNLEEIQTLHRQYLAKAWSALPVRAEELEYTYETSDPSPAESDSHSMQFPLVLRSQEIGSLVLETDQTDLTPFQQALVEGVTTQAALALENIRLLQETQRQAEREKLSSAISSQIWASADTEAILRTALRQLGQVLNATDGMIQLNLD